ncbi:MAG: nucleotidyltransferase family protein [Proteobacteria bacterium]|nr:nucleotidyltransferase family protein [Pseudomonadota bacterium]MBU4288986.1 nucleotidyltransferase family protein [Pseudomonadota bacterium]
MKAQREKRRKTVKLSDITAVILAGGLGTRLRSVLSDRPKVLAEVLGCPFLTYLLDQLSSTGIRKVILCTGYMGDRVQEVYGEMYKSLHLSYSQEDEPLGTGGAFRLALPLIKSNVALVMNGDSYIHADLSSYVDWFFHIDRNASILLAKVPDTSRYGMVKVKKDKSVSAFKEKEKAKGAGWINAGVYLMKTSLLKSIPSGKAFSLEREFFPSLVGNGLFGYQCKGRFIDIGTPESYIKAEKFFSEKKD